VTIIEILVKSQVFSDEINLKSFALICQIDENVKENVYTAARVGSI
jgi:hypothetical protein